MEEIINKKYEIINSRNLNYIFYFSRDVEGAIVSKLEKF